MGRQEQLILIVFINFLIFIAVYYFIKVQQREKHELAKIKKKPYFEIEALSEIFAKAEVQQLKKIYDRLTALGFSRLVDLFVKGAEGKEDDESVFEGVLGNSEVGIYAVISFSRESGDFLVSLITFMPKQIVITSQCDKPFLGEDESSVDFEYCPPQRTLEILLSTHTKKLLSKGIGTAWGKSIGKTDYLARRFHLMLEE